MYLSSLDDLKYNKKYVGGRGSFVKRIDKDHIVLKTENPSIVVLCDWL